MTSTATVLPCRWSYLTREVRSLYCPNNVLAMFAILGFYKFSVTNYTNSKARGTIRFFTPTKMIGLVITIFSANVLPRKWSSSMSYPRRTVQEYTCLLHTTSLQWAAIKVPKEDTTASRYPTLLLREVTICKTVILFYRLEKNNLLH